MLILNLGNLFEKSLIPVGIQTNLVGRYFIVLTSPFRVEYALATIYSLRKTLSQYSLKKKKITIFYLIIVNIV